MADIHTIDRRPTGGTAILPLGLLNGGLGLAALTYGFQFAYPAALRDTIFRSVTALFIVLLLSLLALTLRSRRVLRLPLKLDQATAVFCLFQLGLTLFLALPSRKAVLAIGLLLLIAAFLGKRLGALSVIAWTMACGCAVYAGSLLVIPFDAQSGDMLLFIDHALDVFRMGGDPYTADFGGIDANPFFYLPLQWLIYLPVRVLGGDLRVVNLLSAAAMIAMVEWRCRAGHAALRAAVYPVMLSSLTLPMMHSGQVWPYWLAILGGGLLVANRRWAWAAAILALAIAIRQTALVPVAIIFCGLIGRIGSRRLLWAALVGCAVLAVAVVPFVSSGAAWQMLLVEGPRRALEQAHLQGNPGDQIALSNFLDWVGLAKWDMRVQAALALAMAALASLLGGRGMPTVLTIAGLGYLLTMSANPYMHSYYYVAGFLLAAMGYAAAADTGTDEAGATSAPAL